LLLLLSLYLHGVELLEDAQLVRAAQALDDPGILVETRDLAPSSCW
jgi:hypothetical protein